MTLGVTIVVGSVLAILLFRVAMLVLGLTLGIVWNLFILASIFTIVGMVGSGIMKLIKNKDEWK